MTYSPYARVGHATTGQRAEDDLPWPAKVDLLAAEVAEQERLIESLQLALHNSRRIGIALGVLMTVRHVDRAAAFRLLTDVSRRRHCKVVEAADIVADHGDLPPE